MGCGEWKVEGGTLVGLVAVAYNPEKKEEAPKAEQKPKRTTKKTAGRE